MSGMHWSLAISERVRDKLGFDPASEPRIVAQADWLAANTQGLAPG